MLTDVDVIGSPIAVTTRVRFADFARALVVVFRNGAVWVSLHPCDRVGGWVLVAGPTMDPTWRTSCPQCGECHAERITVWSVAEAVELFGEESV
jgi:hypothetical protein